MYWFQMLATARQYILSRYRKSQNAGWVCFILILCRTELWAKQLDVNFYGVTRLVNAVLPHFRSRKSGTIAFMNSVYAHAAGPGAGAYAVSKHAISGKCSKALQVLESRADLSRVRKSLAERGRRLWYPPDNL